MSNEIYVIYGYCLVRRRWVIFVGSLFGFLRQGGDKIVNASYTLVA